MATFFYFIGVVILWTAVGVLVSVLVSWVARPLLVNRIAFVRTVLTFVFLFAATLALSAYLAEAVVALASSNPYERLVFIRARTVGPYAWAFWLQYLCALLPQLLWLPSLRCPALTVLIVVVASLPTVLHHVA